MESWILPVLWTGLLAGSVHVFTGVDHMSALLTLSVDRKWRAAFLGIRWGVGHSLGVVVIALIAVELREGVLGTDLLKDISGWAESLVGVMLIGIGAFGLRSALKYDLHAHTHEHDGSSHHHPYLHTEDAHAPDDAGEKHVHLHTRTAFLAGTLHGVAGTAHILAVLPALALNRVQGWSYLSAFAAGTIAAMGAFAALVGVSTARLGARAPRVVKRIMVAAATICILVGACWIVLPALGYGLP